MCAPAHSESFLSILFIIILKTISFMLYMQMMVERNNLQKILSFSVILIIFFLQVFVHIFGYNLYIIFVQFVFIYLFTFVNFTRNDGE
jgi:hypothetical protein